MKNMLEIDLSEALLSKTNPNDTEKKEIALAQAQAQVEWLKLHYFPSAVRKSKLENFSIICVGRGKIKIEWNDKPIDFSWDKNVQVALKKILVEDLGNMNAAELLATIPEADSDGRGLSDLRSMEKKLSVKIFFDNETSHVFLIGDSKKLEKKCFPIRNMLSHYHWRLSGTDASFQKS